MRVRVWTEDEGLRLVGGIRPSPLAGESQQLSQPTWASHSVPRGISRSPMSKVHIRYQQTTLKPDAIFHFPLQNSVVAQTACPFRTAGMREPSPANGTYAALHTTPMPMPCPWTKAGRQAGRQASARRRADATAARALDRKKRSMPCICHAAAIHSTAVIATRPQ